MKRLVLVLAIVLALLVPGAAAAHPLGNFTINQFTRIEPSGNRIYLLYVLDMAEIPTFQARGEVAALGREAYAAGLAREIARGLSLHLGGEAAALHEVRHVLAFPDGVGGLKTTRLEVLFETDPLSPGTQLALSYGNANFASRIGWREIVLTATAGARATAPGVPPASISDALRAYPEDLLRSPLDLRSVAATVTPGTAAGRPPALLDGRELRSPAHVASRSESGFAGLIARDRLSLGVALVSLLAAMFWGMVHALSPGHGKSIVAAYLVGTRGRPRDAAYLGAIVTVTHTVGVFALGLVTLALSQFVVPDTLYPWLNLVAALLVVAVGASVLRLRVIDALRLRGGREGERDHVHHDHDPHGRGEEHRYGNGGHHHDDGRDHGPVHTHIPPAGSGLRGLIGVGISGGLLPCPSALVVLLAAISLHRIGYGLVLIVAFSLGLAMTVTGIGLLAVGARRVFNRMSFRGRAVRLLPAFSALVIVVLGLAMTARAIPGLA